MNTQEIQEWEKEYCEKFGLCEKSGKCQCKKELNFISKLLAQQDEKHKRELQTILSKVQEDVNFGAERGQMVQTKAQAYLLTILSKYE